MSYSSFARYYDSLTRNVDYAGHAEYLSRILERLKHKAGITLDLACGTGSLTLELAKRGLDVYGLDASPEMLSVAQQKAFNAGRNILFVCQKMQQMDLYGTVDTAVCMLDSVNHITSSKDLQESFKRVSLFLNPGGYFIFDVNTIYKHRNILAHNVYIYDMEDVYCVWQNAYEPRNDRVAITLDFFERHGKTYYRSSERFYERAYETDALKAMLEKAGLRTEAIWNDMSFDEPDQNAERIVVIARKPV
ncbi:MAG TPA: methyltransferase domain-containing protein [Caproicibacter sp.]|nr:methyltransferase domain-containing protein [Caproicibacter sp.]